MFVRRPLYFRERIQCVRSFRILSFLHLFTVPPSHNMTSNQFPSCLVSLVQICGNNKGHASGDILRSDFEHPLTAGWVCSSRTNRRAPHLRLVEGNLSLRVFRPDDIQGRE